MLNFIDEIIKRKSQIKRLLDNAEAANNNDFFECNNGRRKRPLLEAAQTQVNGEAFDDKCMAKFLESV